MQNKKRGNIKMHIYNVGYHNYEESDYAQLYHEKKFSKKEFENIIIKAAINILKNYETKKEEHISFQDIHWAVISELIKNFGFKEIKFTSEFNVFGWANILDEKDWKHDRDKQLNSLTKAIKIKCKMKKSK